MQHVLTFLALYVRWNVSKLWMCFTTLEFRKRNYSSLDIHVKFTKGRALEKAATPTISVTVNYRRRQLWARPHTRFSKRRGVSSTKDQISGHKADGQSTIRTVIHGHSLRIAILVQQSIDRAIVQPYQKDSVLRGKYLSSQSISISS